MKIQIVDFDWDAGNIEKCQKHGLSIDDVEHVFKNKQLLLAPDIKHSKSESRFIAIGKCKNGKPAFVAFTLRGYPKMIRPISARYMHEKELAAYEKRYSDI